MKCEKQHCDRLVHDEREHLCAFCRYSDPESQAPCDLCGTRKRMPNGFTLCHECYWEPLVGKAWL